MADTVAKAFLGLWRATLIRRRVQQRNFDSLRPRSRFHSSPDVSLAEFCNKIGTILPQHPAVPSDCPRTVSGHRAVDQGPLAVSYPLSGTWLLLGLTADDLYKAGCGSCRPATMPDAASARARPPRRSIDRLHRLRHSRMDSLIRRRCASSLAVKRPCFSSHFRA